MTTYLRTVAQRKWPSCIDNEVTFIATENLLFSPNSKPYYKTSKHENKGRIYRWRRILKPFLKEIQTINTNKF